MTTVSVPCNTLLFFLSSMYSARLQYSQIYQASVGIAALLAAFPPCLGSSDDHKPQIPLTSGSVCRVRDSLDFLDVSVWSMISWSKLFHVALGTLDLSFCLPACKSLSCCVLLPSVLRYLRQKFRLSRIH